MEQLLKLTPSFDLADEAGRLNLSRDLCDLLQNDKTSPSLTRILVKGFSLIEPRLEVRISKLLEVISELREPLTQAEIPISEDQLRKNKLEVIQTTWFTRQMFILKNHLFLLFSFLDCSMQSSVERT